MFNELVALLYTYVMFDRSVGLRITYTTIVTVINIAISNFLSLFPLCDALCKFISKSKLLLTYPHRSHLVCISLLSA